MLRCDEDKPLYCILLVLKIGVVRYVIYQDINHTITILTQFNPHGVKLSKRSCSGISNYTIHTLLKAGMWEKSLSLFEEMEVNGVLRDEDCYSGAIWACVGGTKWQKSVELLKLMKFEGS